MDTKAYKTGLHDHCVVRMPHNCSTHACCTIHSHTTPLAGAAYLDAATAQGATFTQQPCLRTVPRLQYKQVNTFDPTRFPNNRPLLPALHV
mmetsp:Transcript_30617/g.67815  ORF Transcript_30617/g.67815 Transcript_30617/m.67815 type:complete len:91 (-) Transcript_30617:927-1199(-)